MASTILRSSYICGPALVIWNTNGKFYTKDVIELRPNVSTFNVGTDAAGTLDERVDDMQMVVTCTPEGRVNPALFVAGTTAGSLWPYGARVIGSSIFGTTDTTGDTDATLVIESKDLTKHTLYNVAITKMPTLTLSPNKTSIGSIEFTGIRKGNTAWTVADSIYKQEVGSAFVDTGFAATDILTQYYTGVWTGITGFTEINTMDGWTIDFNVETQDITTDYGAVIDKRITNVSAMARCTPVGLAPTSAQVLTEFKVDGTGVARGMTRVKNAADLVITGADAATIITLKNATLKTAGFRFGTTTLRLGEIGFVTMPVVTSGSRVATTWTIAHT